MVDLERIADSAATEGINVSHDEADLLLRHAQSVCDWNYRARLVGRADLDFVITQQTIPSLLVVRAFRSGAIHGSKVLDVGSGAGFPAIPCAALLREVEFVLVEATRKKAQFLGKVAESLDLLNVTAKWARVENISDLEEERFDCISSRAVGPPARIAAIAGRFAGRLASLACFVPSATSGDLAIPSGWSVSGCYASSCSPVSLVVLNRTDSSE